jgi:hypothetical protein
METTLVIKNILLPKLEKDPNFSKEKVDSAFWGKFANNLLHFEEDAKRLYAIIYSLELSYPEKIIDKLSNIYAQFLKELAESYVLGQTSEATNYLLKTSNATFLKDVRFLETMQQAIKSVERKRIKEDLPNSYERLAFELSESNMANVIKKKSREDLKKKFKQWGAELEEVRDPVYSNHNSTLANDTVQNQKSKKETKVISLSWIKYAAAASIIIAAGIFYFKNTDTDLVPIENTVVTKEKVEDKIQPQLIPPTIEAIVVAPIETTSRTIIILQQEFLGYISDKKVKITINFKDATKRILSLEKVLEQDKTVDSKILDQYKSELIQLKAQKDKYVFEGETLTLFNKKGTSDYAVIQLEEQVHYLKKGDGYYTLKVNNTPLVLEKVSNPSLIETLDKISF